MKPIGKGLRAGAIAILVMYLGLTGQAVWAALGSVVFSVSTDKKVYYYSEPVRVEVIGTNPTDDFLYISLAVPYYRTLAVVEPITNRTVYQIEFPVGPAIGSLASVFTPHSQQTIAMVDIPAYTLASGNKKYRVMINLSVGLRHGTVTDVVLSNAATTITVR